jgi:hypothetical protein
MNAIYAILLLGHLQKTEFGKNSEKRPCWKWNFYTRTNLKINTLQNSVINSIFQ